MSTLDDSYDAYKNLSYINNFALNQVFLFTVPTNLPIPTLNAFDTFRANWEGNFNTTLTPYSSLFTNNYLSLNVDNLNKFYPSQLLGNYNLLYTVKNISNTHDAIQKIFRTKIDESRSHVNLSEFNQSVVKNPFITSVKVDARELVGKNLYGFFDTSLFKPVNTLPTYPFYTTNIIENTYLYDFPFLMSVKSDASRYI
jgi:hypothetical protein